MNKIHCIPKVLSLVSLFITSNAVAQIEFEKGYIITDENQKIECLIRNIDWLYNPKYIEYKLSENDELKTVGPQFIKEFGVYGYSKYLGRTIKVDKSSDQLEMLSHQWGPEWVDQPIFLKVVLEGKISLLSYEQEKIKRFFVQTPDTIEQLVYKKYLVRDNQFGINNSFKQQLFNLTRACHRVSETMVKNLIYSKEDLNAYFKTYNECFGVSTVNYNKAKNRVSFRFKIFTSINSTSLSVKDGYHLTTFNKSIDYHGTNFSIGAEPEFILPFNKNKWSIFLGTNYQSFQAKKNLYNIRHYSSGPDTLVIPTTVKYQLIELPLGARYYSYLNKNTRLFFSAFITTNLLRNSRIDLGGTDAFDMNASIGEGLGVGLDFYNLCAELRYITNKDFLKTFEYWKAPYQQVSFLIGYNLFRKTNKDI
jgi:hypothetical protein